MEHSGGTKTRNERLRKIRGEVLVNSTERSEDQHLSHYIENSPLGMIEADTASVILKWSARSEQIFGWSEQEVIGKKISDLSLIHSEDIALVKSRTGRLFGTDRTGISHNRNITKSGRVIDCVWYNSVLFDNAGNISSIMSLIDDVTEEKKGEEELLKSKKKLEIALETANIGTWEYDLPKGIMTWDERTKNILGFTGKKYPRTLEAFSNYINENELSHLRYLVERALKSDLPVITTFRLKSKDDKEKNIYIKAILTKNAEGIPAGFTGVCFDLTGVRDNAELKMIRLNEELLRSNKELEEFAYVASHDLQEPLRMISSFTQLLAQRYARSLDDNAREYISYAVEGSKKMYDLINGLLAYSRIQTRGHDFKEVNMQDAIEQALKNLSIHILESKAVINYSGLPVVIADEAQMVQLFQNLIDNAIRFSERSPVIRVSAKKNDKYFKFAVKDEGIGIEPQYFSRIFRIFQQLNPMQYRGTGIGLSICKRIVERHGGKIWVISQPGKGSTFYFIIPSFPNAAQITE